MCFVGSANSARKAEFLYIKLLSKLKTFAVIIVIEGCHTSSLKSGRDTLKFRIKSVINRMLSCNVSVGLLPK